VLVQLFVGTLKCHGLLPRFARRNAKLGATCIEEGPDLFLRSRGAGGKITAVHKFDDRHTYTALLSNHRRITTQCKDRGASMIGALIRTEADWIAIWQARRAELELSCEDVDGLAGLSEATRRRSCAAGENPTARRLRGCAPRWRSCRRFLSTSRAKQLRAPRPH
jgi:hypothetical protein